MFQCGRLYLLRNDIEPIALYYISDMFDVRTKINTLCVGQYLYARG